MRLRDRVRAHLGSPDVARTIYGSIIGLALVLALQVHPPTAAQTMGALIGTGLAVGLAELYSELVAGEARNRRGATREELRHMAGEASVVAVSAGFPAVFFFLAAIGVFETHLAFTLAKWSGLGLISTYGFLGARLSGSSTLKALLHAAAVGAVAGALIAFKALLH